jgi:hypothetical protein
MTLIYFKQALKMSNLNTCIFQCTAKNNLESMKPTFINNSIPGSVMVIYNVTPRCADFQWTWCVLSICLKWSVIILLLVWTRLSHRCGSDILIFIFFGINSKHKKLCSEADKRLCTHDKFVITFLISIPLNICSMCLML